MDHADHVALLRDGVSEAGFTSAGRTWADLGSGAGAFTLALADLLGRDGRIHSVDRDASALRRQADLVAGHFPGVTLTQHRADFTQPMDGLPMLDGIVMANSLHFVADKVPLLRRLARHVRPGGRFVLVEYDTDAGNPWVPHPLSYRTWERVAGDAGLIGTHRLEVVPSRFLGAIYSAVSTVGTDDSVARSGVRWMTRHHQHRRHP